MCAFSCTTIKLIEKKIRRQSKHRGYYGYDCNYDCDYNWDNVDRNAIVSVYFVGVLRVFIYIYSTVLTVTKSVVGGVTLFLLEIIRDRRTETKNIK